MKKPGFIQKTEKALSGKGFYMVLLLCLVLLGASGFFLYRSLGQAAEVVSGQAEVTIPAVVKPSVGDDTAVPSGTDALETDATEEEQSVLEPLEEAEESEPTEAEPEAQPVSEPVEESVPATTAALLAWPVEGEVVAAFSSTELTYNAALGDWRTHSGIDIAAALGDEVLAAASGVVESIVSDPVTGTTITLSHSGDMTTVYGNLDPDTLCVAEGDGVTAGQVLACVGSSAAGEDGSAPFLHFAVAIDGESVDPTDYLS